MYKFRQEKGGEVRTILKLAVQKLPKRKHIKVITKFAQLEFQQGSLERGRTIMEGVLSNYPKRVDLWSQYLDMEIKAGHGDSSDKSQSGRGGGKGERKSQACIRRLFDRITSMSGFSTKKMKFFFKRYMDYESKHGDEDSVDDVKDKAREYVQSKMQE